MRGGLAAVVVIGVLSRAFVAAGAEPPTQPGALDARARAEAHYRSGLALFDSGNREQALVEFQLAHEESPSWDAVFMMAQCEYHLGDLKAAHKHYEEFLAHAPSGTLATTAQMRIQAIDRRPSVFAITTVPDSVEVVIESVTSQREPLRVVGQAPNEFKVPRGRYRVTVRRPNFATQTRDVEIGIAETRTLFFKLDPVPARLEVRTTPRGATLYVRGNRAQNPYLQLVEPGAYEIYAEATNYQGRRESFTLGPGETRRLQFDLKYVQRSGRPELIWFSTLMGALAGGTAVSARLELTRTPKVGSLSLVAAGSAVFAVAGALVSTAFAPRYIPDNRAIFRMGSMALGTAEGALVGIALLRAIEGDTMTRPTMTAGWVGGAAGLAIGTLAGVKLDGYAPNYGRVAVIESAAGWGLASAALAMPAFAVPDKYAELTLLTGLNLGLVTGLAMAYLPDQRTYGPTWQRVMLVNLAGTAGAFAGSLVTAIADCTDETLPECSFNSAKTTTKLTLAGAGLGLVAGWLLTRAYDAQPSPGDDARPGTRVTLAPGAPVMAVQTPHGQATLVPALAGVGRF